MSISDTDRAYADVLELLYTRSLECWDTRAFICEVAECLRSVGMQLEKKPGQRAIISNI